MLKALARAVQQKKNDGFNQRVDRAGQNVISCEYYPFLHDLREILSIVVYMQNFCVHCTLALKQSKTCVYDVGTYSYTVVYSPHVAHTFSPI
jgi:hypothetical protein